MKTIDIYTARVENYDTLHMNRDLNKLMQEVCEIHQLDDEPYEDHLLRDGDEVYGGWLQMLDEDGLTVKVEIYYNDCVEI